jgi:hypothetical protein
MTAIGLDRPTPELAGSDPIMMVASSLMATGKEIEGTYTTIIDGTMTETTATTIAITRIIAIAANNQRHEGDRRCANRGPSIVMAGYGRR